MSFYLCGENGGASLPEVTMYGGDTTPWSFLITNQDGSPYPSDSLSGSEAKLTMAPYAVSSGLGSAAVAIPPVMTKTGSVSSDPSGVGTVLFYLTKEDTIDLRGKYIYQVEVSKDDDMRVLQGIVTIKQNINRV